MKVSAILAAAGRSSRMGGIDKLSVDLGGITVLGQSVKRLLHNSEVSELVIVARPESRPDIERMIDEFHVLKPVKLVDGGRTRFLSIQNGVAAASADAEYYLMHDAARPFVSDELISKTIEAALLHKAAASGVKVTDTIKIVDESGFVEDTPDRSKLLAVGTPQVFEAKLYREAAMVFGKDEAYDDCEVVEAAGKPVFLVEGDPGNIKITTPADIGKPSARDGLIRLGHGYDAHRFAAGRDLILGGVSIPFELGLLGHSDADVLAHAVIDALLGAAALGDIGRLFPDSDRAYEGMCSLVLLRETSSLIKSSSYRIVNIDSTVICQRPKLADYIDAMRANIAGAIGIPKGAVSVKATTEEGLGFTGEMKGAAAHAVAFLDRL